LQFFCSFHLDYPLAMMAKCRHDILTTQQRLDYPVGDSVVARDHNPLYNSNRSSAAFTARDRTTAIASRSHQDWSLSFRTSLAWATSESDDLGSEQLVWYSSVDRTKRQKQRN